MGVTAEYMSEVMSLDGLSSIWVCTYPGCVNDKPWTRLSLVTHVWMKHLAETKTCPQCSREIRQPGAYTQHLKSHALKKGVVHAPLVAAQSSEDVELDALLNRISKRLILNKLHQVEARISGEEVE